MVRAALITAATASGALAQEQTVAECVFPRVGGDVEIRISQEREVGYWTEGDRRAELQLIRSGPRDLILGMTVNRLDGSIAMLSLFRPPPEDVTRRRNALLTIHRVTRSGGVLEESLQGFCDVEDLS